MKKRIIRFLTLFLFFILLFTVLTGCKTDRKNESKQDKEANTSKEEQNSFQMKTDTEKAFYIWDLQEKKKGMESYVIDITYSAKGEMAGVSFAVSGKGMEITILSKGKTYLYEEFQQSIDVGNGQYTAEQAQKRGYINGKMFSYQSENGVGDGIYSELSAEDWKEYYQNKAEDSEFQLTEEIVTDVKFETTENGHQAIFRGFTEEGIEQIERDLELSQIMGEKPSDCEIKLAVGSSLLPTELSIRLIYDADEGEEASEFLMEGVFRDYNCAKIIPVDFSGYRNVGDLRIAEDLEKYIENLGKEPAVSFQYSEHFGVWLDQADLIFSSGMIADVSMSNGKNGFAFSVVSETGEKIWYENGRIYMQLEGYTQKNLYSETEARSRIREWYDPTSFAIHHIERAEYYDTFEETVTYSVRLSEVDLSLFQPVFDACEVTENDAKNVEACIEFAIEENRLKGISYSITCDLVLGSDTMNLEYTSFAIQITYSE